MKTYKINTYGCQMNVHESEKIAGILRSLDYFPVEESNCDVVIFNTCCIRDSSEKKIAGHIGEYKNLKKLNPNMIVCVCGCMSQQDDSAKKLFEKFPFIDIILGTSNIHLLADEILKVSENRVKILNVEKIDKPEIIENLPTYRTSGSNAWLNIMYGCNNFCTYCIVPYVRGRERSRKIEDVMNEFIKLVQQGYKEITLLGQNVNSYGSDFDNGINFATLLNEISKIEGDFRVKFMTSHPKDFSLEIIEIIAKSKNISHYIHLPIQSGSNRVLKLMNRHYTREDYLAIVKEVRKIMPNCGITTDIMVGFPYESEEDFQDTLKILEEVKFSAAFTFIYSSRKGTKASEMEQIPYEIKSERISRLINNQNEITREVSKQMVGSVVRVLCDKASEKTAGLMSGRCDEGRLVDFKGTEEMIGTFVNILIKSYNTATLHGEVFYG